MVQVNFVVVIERKPNSRFASVLIIKLIKEKEKKKLTNKFIHP